MPTCLLVPSTPPSSSTSPLVRLLWRWFGRARTLFVRVAES
ncbi:hypothetical protein I309_06379 [Cryptococcus deuterogattii LA55]|nr:hypothetical protein I309_06379 [Cryptococcus deuterogattii LA55]KIR95271.1 hypothetical protein I304_00016 [Cryptococcus deuterogattii CBS 10090]